jgi:hypothetical protein
MRWPVAVGVGLATIVIATKSGVFPGVTVALAAMGAAAVLAIWGDE